MRGETNKNVKVKHEKKGKRKKKSPVIWCRRPIRVFTDTYQLLLALLVTNNFNH